MGISTKCINLKVLKSVVKSSTKQTKAIYSHDYYTRIKLGVSAGYANVQHCSIWNSSEKLYKIYLKIDMPHEFKSRIKMNVALQHRVLKSAVKSSKNISKVRPNLQMQEFEKFLFSSFCPFSSSDQKTTYNRLNRMG